MLWFLCAVIYSGITEDAYRRPRFAVREGQLVAWSLWRGHQRPSRPSETHVGILIDVPLTSIIMGIISNMVRMWKDTYLCMILKN